MRQFIAFTYVVLFVLSGSATAGPMFSGLPATHTPGDSFSFEVRLGNVTDLGSYSLQLLLESTAGTAGVDYFFQTPVVEPASGYVFGSYVAGPPFAGGQRFGLTANALVDPGGADTKLTLGDGLYPGILGVDTTSGVNDLVAMVTVVTTASSGDLTLGFNSAFANNLSEPVLVPPQPPTPIGFTLPNPQSIPSTAASPVPEPSTGSLLVIGAGALALARFCRKRAA